MKFSKSNKQTPARPQKQLHLLMKISINSERFIGMLQLRSTMLQTKQKMLLLVA